jgi:tripeptide aminopeptidase
MINKERVLQRFLTLVQTDSQTRKEGRMADLLQRELKGMGFTVVRDQAGVALGGETGNLIAKLPGTKPGKPLLLCAHMDRVSPGVGIKPQVKDGIITSDGTTILAADDCAGLATILEAVQSALEQGIDRPDLEVVFTIAEEGGLNGAKNLDFSLLRATEAYIVDSGTPVGSIINQGPAQTKLTYRVIGKAAHGGVAPEKGISALQVAGVALSRMKLGRIDHETTANLGIASGGTSTNVVMETFEMKGDARSLVIEKMEAQIRHMTETFEQAAKEFGARVEAEIQFAYGPINLKPGDEVLERAAAAVRRAGLEPRLMATGGGSDANIFNTKGIPATNLGCGYTGAHALTESIAVESLEKLAEILFALIQEYAS